MADYVKTYSRLETIPFGKKVFNVMLRRASPYVSQLRPEVLKLETGYCEIRVKNRNAVHNHIGAVDSNALFTLAQLAMGVSMETWLPSSLRWIPLGATIEYVQLAKSDVVGSCDCRTPTGIVDESATFPIVKEVTACISDSSGNIVQRAVIRVQISRRTRSKN
jgi:acyl-coenzyme A thioesterase PaaI-like protein